MTKHLIILTVLCLTLYSCDKEPAELSTITTPTNNSSVIRSKEEAINIAAKAQEDFFGRNTKSSYNDNSIDVKQVYLKTKPFSREQRTHVEYIRI